MNGVHKQPGNPFHALSSSHELQQLFSRYPHLRNQLEIIFNATLEAPQGDFGNSASIAGRNNPSRGRGRGRGRVRGGSGSGPSWTQERGFKSGLHRLKKSRDRELSEAEGLKEFSALALKLNEYEASFKSGSTSGNGALDAIRADLQAVGPEM
ncbi:hypothetical protein MMC08_002307 [Hypocenomyce scalaris]|nr:hypothetical protein [Hypocenomyce scalaris]